MVVKTADESLIEFRQSMGHGLGTHFHFCRQQLFDVASQWDIYTVFFGHQERVNLLNKCDGFLAYQMERLFLRSVTLGLMRLLDPQKSLGKKNLTLMAFPELCAEKLKVDLDLQLKALTEMSKPLAAIRNKIIAHNDFEQSTNSATPLNFSSRLEFTEMIKRCNAVLNIVEGHYCSATTHLRPVGDHGARSLLIRLFHSENWRKERLRLALGGEINLSKERPLEWPDFIDEGTEDFERYQP